MALPTLKQASPRPLRSTAVQEPSWQRDVRQATPRIDVKFPILGFLMDSEATGYDLKRRFRHPVGFFYRVSDGSLYPALKKLARDELVTQRIERHGKRSRKIYAITDEGRARFLKMLREPAQPIFVFDEAQVKIYFAQHDPQAALTHMEHTHQEDRERAQMLRWLANEMEKNGESVFRKALVEIGCAVSEAKAKVFARLFGEVRDTIVGNGRSRTRHRTARAAG
ncbi:MAG TPA: PadR family transcriptional regulator [Candidatus Binataceae bacterium]|nr:PadR family transcriptional regulator [Candidatus Binataceae bacterium]